MVYEWIAPAWRGWAFAALALLFLLTGHFTMNPPGARVRAPRGFRLQLAFTPARAKRACQAWSADQHDAAVRAIWWDFLFLVVYPLLLSFLCGWAAGLAGWGASWTRIGVILAWSQVAAGALDLVENAALLAILATLRQNKLPSAMLTATGGVAATLKFIIAGVGCVYVLVGGAAGAVRSMWAFITSS